jgi:hypothetical protein
VTGRGRKLRNEDLHNLHSSPNVIGVTKSKMRWVGHVASLKEMRNVHKICTGKPELMKTTWKTQAYVGGY